MTNQLDVKRRALVVAMAGVFPLFATRDGMAGSTATGAISNHDRAIALITTFERPLLHAKGARYE